MTNTEQAAERVQAIIDEFDAEGCAEIRDDDAPALRAVLEDRDRLTTELEQLATAHSTETSRRELADDALAEVRADRDRLAARVAELEREREQWRAPQSPTQVYICPACTRITNPTDDGVAWGPGGILWCSETCFAAAPDRANEEDAAYWAAAVDWEQRAATPDRAEGNEQ